MPIRELYALSELSQARARYFGPDFEVRRLTRNRLLEFVVRRRSGELTDRGPVGVNTVHQDIGILKATTGRRRGANCQLCYSDLDFERKLIRWRAASDKARKTRVVPMPEALVPVLLAFRRVHPRDPRAIPVSASQAAASAW